MAKTLSEKILDIFLNTIDIEFVIPLGFAEIKLPILDKAKKWWENKKAHAELLKAIQTAEDKFVAENPNNKAAQILHDISLKDEKDFQIVIADLINHPNEGKIIEIAALKLVFGFEKYVSKEELEKALNDFLPYLRRELIAIEGFQNIISAIAILRIDRTTSETLIGVKELNIKTDQILGNQKPKPINLPAYEPENLVNIEEIPEPGKLPPGSRMSHHRNAVFTGRDEDLKYLATALLSNKKTTLISQTTAAIGMGGIGKTQLAVEFCYRYGRYFHGVHWINSRENRIDTEIAACGTEMGLTSSSENVQEQVNLTIKAWQAQPFRLLIFDNLEDPNILAQWLPRLNSLHILITARRQQWNPDLGIDIFPIETLPRMDSITLLQRLAPRLKNSPHIDIDLLAERLGDLPLALDLAGRYLNARRSLTVEEYLQQLNRLGNTLEHTSLAGWVKDSSPTSHETSLAATFLLSWQQLTDSDVDDLAKRLFISGGYLAPTIPIPHSLLLCIAISAAEWIPINNEIPYVDLSKIDFTKISESVDDSTLRLQQLGLLNETLSLHPLLCEYARAQASDTSILSILIERMVFLSLIMLNTYVPAYFSEIRSHIEILAPIAESHDLKNASLLWNSLGQHLHEIGENFGSRNILEKALDIAEKEIDLNHSIVLGIKGNLAMTLKDIGELHEARKILTETLEVMETNNKENTYIGATVINNLGMVLLDLNLVSDAKKMFSRALQIDENIFGEDHAKIATRLNNIGLTLSRTKDYSGAKKVLERALKIRRKYYQTDHPHIAQSLHNLAYVLKELGKFSEAKKLFEQSLQMGYKVYGDEHPEIALWEFNYANLLNDMGKLQQAKKMYKKSLVFYENIYGSESYEFSYKLILLANVLMQLNEYPEAAKLTQDAVNILKKTNSPEAKYAFQLLVTIKFLENQNKKTSINNKRRKK